MVHKNTRVSFPPPAYRRRSIFGMSRRYATSAATSNPELWALRSLRPLRMLSNTLHVYPQPLEVVLDPERLFEKSPRRSSRCGPVAVKTTKWGLFRRLCALVGAQTTAYPEFSNSLSRHLGE